MADFEKFWVYKYQVIYSTGYAVGSLIAGLLISKQLNCINWVIFILGIASSIPELFLCCIDLNESSKLTLIYIACSITGIICGIMQPFILQKIAINSNRPEFFISFFNFLASISIIIVISLPSYCLCRRFNIAIYITAFFMIVIASHVINK
jgi:uncharacterized membrane-anchored protein